jgi:hypothetical protein
VASCLGLNGYVYEMDYSLSGGKDMGSDAPPPIGIFKGFCTVVSPLRSELLCSYEIYLSTSGPNGVGGIIANGLMQGVENTAIVTGSEYDFAPYSSGSLTTLLDPELPILYAYLSLE